jgi:L-phenylalanine/L-methionine N-acetyltransferase
MPRADIVVRRATVADAAALARIMSHPSVLRGLLQLPLANEELWRQRLQGPLAPSPVNNDLQLVAELDGQVVGSAGMHLAPQLRRRHCAHLGISVDPAAQRQGVGTALMQTMCDYADGWVQVLRLELTVFIDNAGAIALYERFGFRTEGTHRAYAMRDGVYCDVLAMARLHPRPPSLNWPS